MFEIDLTITITVVIAVCAIVSPIITTLLNNHHLYKMRKLDMKLDTEQKARFYKRDVYEDYLKTAGKCIACSNNENMSAYGEAYMLALIYFPSELRNELIHINDYVVKCNRDQAITLLNQLAPKIHTILQSM